ncbi:MAG TPA: NADH-quinone oxidoreductase subunit NuoK [Candidatus Fraserbacteria bacterium]|nr:NADH-quinone oxidoreductase subunit NuoK [Candidatus Fraserbacteria bacterium]
MMPLMAYIALSAGLAAIGAYGLLVSRNAIKVLMCIELLLNAGNLNLVAFSTYYHDATGYVLTVFSIALAAAEAAVGLSILIVLFRLKGRMDLTLLDLLKG